MLLNNIEHCINDLLEHLGSSFCLEAPVANSTLGELFETTILEAVKNELVDFATPGEKAILRHNKEGVMHFFYRPHLFPGMDDALLLGHLVQYMLLPRDLPENSPVKIAAMLESYCHLSGDLFGWQPTSDNGIMVWLLDVSGHGVRAGFAAVIFKLLLADTDPNIGLSQFVGEIEQRFLQLRNPEDEGCLYATGLFLKIGQGGEVEYISAGHPPMLLKRPNEIGVLNRTGLPMGLFPEMEKTSRRFQLKKEEVLLLFSDGLSDLEDQNGKVLGLDRISSLLSESPMDQVQVVSNITDAIAGFHDLKRLNDDLSLMAIQLER